NDGALFVGTGDRGKIFRVDRTGKGELYFDTRQSHVTSLAVDPKGALLAGSDPNGILYRITAKDKVFVLYDSPLAEIRDIQVAPDGMIYAAAMGGAASKASQMGAVGGGDVTVAPMSQSITVTATPLQGGAQLPKPPGEAGKQPQQASVAPAAAATPVGSVAGGPKSALLRIAPDNTVETLWTSNEENVYAVLPQPSGLLFSTDDHGR